MLARAVMWVGGENISLSARKRSQAGYVYRPREQVCSLTVTFIRETFSYSISCFATASIHQFVYMIDFSPRFSSALRSFPVKPRLWSISQLLLRYVQLYVDIALFHVGQGNKQHRVTPHAGTSSTITPQSFALNFTLSLLSP